MRSFLFAFVSMIFLSSCSLKVYHHFADGSKNACQKCVEKISGEFQKDLSSSCSSCKKGKDCKSCKDSPKCKNGICPLKTTCTDCKDGKECRSCKDSPKCKSGFCPMKARKSSASSCCSKS